MEQKRVKLPASLTDEIEQLGASYHLDLTNTVILLLSLALKKNVLGGEENNTHYKEEREEEEFVI